MGNMILLDQTTRVAPLGLGFWDPVTNSFVTEGLQVTAAPKISGIYRGTPAVATANRSGIFAFHHLPGLSEMENGLGDRAYWISLPTTKDFMVTVKDRYNRFLPFQFPVQAPVRRETTWSLPSPQTVPDISTSQTPGIIPLFSSPARPVPPGTAGIRASIRMDKASAAWAVVEAYSQSSITDPDELTLVARGIANRDGEAVLIFHYPKFMNVDSGKDTLPLTAQKWFISVKVFFSLEPPYPKIPDLSEIAGQTETRIVSLERPGDDVPDGRACLKYGRELILKTKNGSELQIEAKS